MVKNQWFFDQNANTNLLGIRIFQGKAFHWPGSNDSFLCRRLLKIVGVDEVAYDELIEEISVRREDEAYAWADLKPKIIAALIEVFQEAVMSHQLAKMSHNSGMTHHSIKDAYHLDNLSVRWDREDGIIDNIISAGLKPVLNQTNSGKYDVILPNLTRVDLNLTSFDL